MKRILITLIAVALLSLTAQPAQAWYPGQRIVQGVRGFVAGRVDGVRRRSQRRQARRAEGRGLGRLGIGNGGTHYGGECANGVCR